MLRTLALLAAAQCADLLTTWYGLAHGTHEANPATLAAVAAFGWAGVAFVKLGCVPAAGTLAYLAPDDRTRALVLKAVRVAATMLLGVALANVLVVL